MGLNADCVCDRAHAMMDVGEVLAATQLVYAHRLLALVKRGEFPAPAEAPKGTALIWSRAAVTAWMYEHGLAELFA